MPAPIVLVLNEPETRKAAVAALVAIGLEITSFDDPMAALDAVEKDSRVRVVISRTDFGPGKLNGVALLRMLRHKQIGHDGRSNLRGVFVGPLKNGHVAEQDGDFVPMPIDPQVLVSAVEKALAEG